MGAASKCLMPFLPGAIDDEIIRVDISVGIAHCGQGRQGYDRTSGNDPSIKDDVSSGKPRHGRRRWLEAEGLGYRCRDKRWIVTNCLQLLRML